MELPNAMFGTAEPVEVNWRERLANEPDEDDDEITTTPSDVVGMLGFDPQDMPDDE